MLLLLGVGAVRPKGATVGRQIHITCAENDCGGLWAEIVHS